MSTTSKTTYPRMLAAVSTMLTIPMASAAEINQTVNSNSTTSWNDAMWGTPAAAPTAGNDYRTVASGSSTNIYTINGTTWSQLSWTVQSTDANNLAAASTSSTFAGNSLIVSTNAPINWKATGGSIQSANIVFDGGFIRGNTLDGAAVGFRSSTLTGAISFATPTTVAAIGALSPNSNVLYEFTISSTITGAAGNLLQLTLAGGTVNARNVAVSLTGDLSNYYGTIYAGVPTSALGGALMGPDCSFGITSNAVNATVQLDTTTNYFRYNLGSGNVNFAGLRYGSGAGTPVVPGIYDAADLNTLTSTSAFFGTGTITVAPPDSDGDGLPDSWETAHGLDPNDDGTVGESSTGAKDGPNGALGDPDNDGDSNLAEYNAGSDPQNSDSTVLDTDADGLGDAWEMTYFSNLSHGPSGDEDGDLNTNDLEEFYGTDPTNDTSFPDGDNDGLSLVFELTYGLNDDSSNFPYGPGDDPDGDLYSNLEEQQAKFTDPNNQLSSPDSDGDGLVDGWEVKYFFNTDRATTLAQYNGTSDPDGDRYNNEAEETAGTDPTDIARKPTDTDADGLLDSYENFHFSGLSRNPTDNGDDADGFDLLAEQNAGSDPFDTDSTPTDIDANMIPDTSEVLQPYTADSNTLHLWHLDELDQTVLDNGSDPVTLTALVNDAQLWEPSTGPFKTGLNTSAHRGTGLGGALCALPLADGPADNTTIQYMNATTGAFTYEAIVKLGFDPTITPSSTNGMSIISGDGDTTERLFNFRLVPIGHPDNTSGGTATQLEFLKLGGGVEHHRVNLPGAGDPDQALQGNWYHVAVTYDGNENTAGNLKLYWTLLDPSRTAAHEVNSSQMATDLPAGVQPDFCLGNEARNTGGTNETFLGVIDEVRMSDNARSSTSFLFSSASGPDSDSDGMDDTWEITYGLNVGIDDSADDLDGDGTNNLAEFRLGLIPNDGSSSFIATRNVGSGQITWPSQEGLTFRVERSTTLLGAWTVLETAWPAASSPATSTSYTDGSPPVGKAFYRIGLNP